MERMLPIDTSIHLDEGASRAYMLSMFMAHEHLKPWVFENYVFIRGLLCRLDSEINPISKYIGYSDEYFYADLGWQELIEKNGIPTDVLTACDIYELIKSTINKGQYLIVFVDEYYLPFCNMGGVSHFLHEEFIYGYNDEEQAVYSLGINKNQVFAKINNPVTAYREAFARGLTCVQHGNIEWARENRIITFTLPKFQTPYPYSAERYVAKLRQYLEGGLPKRDIYLRQYEVLGTPYIGTDFYRLIELKVGREEHVYFEVANLYEHKYLMRICLEHLMRRESLPIEELIDTYQQQVENAAKLLKYFLIKIESNKDKSCFSQRILEKLAAIEQNERVVIEAIIATADKAFLLSGKESSTGLR